MAIKINILLIIVIASIENVMWMGLYGRMCTFVCEHLSDGRLYRGKNGSNEHLLNNNYAAIRRQVY